MNKLTEKALITQVAVRAYVARQLERARSDERGQGTVEYVGIVVIVVAVIGTIVMWSDEIGNSIREQLQDAVKDVGKRPKD